MPWSPETATEGEAMLKSYDIVVEEEVVQEFSDAASIDVVILGFCDVVTQELDVEE